jgi:hypothetical protein
MELELFLELCPSVIVDTSICLTVVVVMVALIKSFIKDNKNKKKEK